MVFPITILVCHLCVRLSKTVLGRTVLEWLFFFIIFLVRLYWICCFFRWCFNFYKHCKIVNDTLQFSTIVKLFNYIIQVSQHTPRQEGDAGLTDASSMGGRCAESPPTFIRGKRRKNRKGACMVCELWVWKVRELYLRTGKVLAPHTSVPRDGSL